jgi:hypothetical protein
MLTAHETLRLELLIAEVTLAISDAEDETTRTALSAELAALMARRVRSSKDMEFVDAGLVYRW